MIKPNRLLPIDDCNQHKVNAPHVIQGRRHFLNNDFQQLYKTCDQNNERNSTQEGQAKWYQNEVVQKPCQNCTQGNDRGNGKAHTD